MGRQTVISVAAVAMLAWSGIVEASPQVVEIKTLPSGGSSFAGVNGGNAGWYAGYSGGTSGGVGWAPLDNHASILPLNTPGYDSTIASDADDGRFVGFVQRPGQTVTTPALWRSPWNSVVELESGNLLGYARAIVRNTVVGSYTSSGRQRAWKWDVANLPTIVSTTMHPTTLNNADFGNRPTVFGYNSEISETDGVNSVGWISQFGSGGSIPTNQVRRAARWGATANSYQLLPNPESLPNSFATSLHGSSIGGFSYDYNADSFPQAVFWSGTGPFAVTKLHPAGYLASRVNAVFETLQAGWAESSGDLFPIIWLGSAGSAINLADLLPDHDAGQINGIDISLSQQTGTLYVFGYFDNVRNGRTEALRIGIDGLIPEPTSLSVLLLAGGAILPRSRRR
jgi:hypothetical protein